MQNHNNENFDLFKWEVISQLVLHDSIKVIWNCSSSCRIHRIYDIPYYDIIYNIIYQNIARDLFIISYKQLKFALNEAWRG